jgi:hypothetical protein
VNLCTKKVSRMPNLQTTQDRPLQVSGVFPHLCLTADLGPPRSEGGTGAMVAFAGKLWIVTYVSHKRGSGAGTGLYEIDADLRMRKRAESVVGTYANRFLHHPTNQLIIGPHIIDAAGNVRTFEQLVDLRLCATMAHLDEPDRKVYFLGMEGEFLEADVMTLSTRQLFDLTRELAIAETTPHDHPVQVPEYAQPHFKAGHTAQGRVVVSNNTYDEKDFAGRGAGRLAEWDGRSWRIIERAAFIDVAGRLNFGAVVFATGWDRASAILKALVDGTWQTYRLPKASHTFDHFWQSEWPRIREVEHERLLVDCHGMFYELSPVAFGGRVFGMRPICTHLRVIPDFCSYRGMLVLGGNQVTPTGDVGLLVAEPQANLWFGDIDDLWRWGKPKGWGGPWWETSVVADAPSDPYLMTGFDQKVLHLLHDDARSVRMTVEVDFLGNGTWCAYGEFDVAPGAYVHHEFPPGFSAHWVRVRAGFDCRATAYLTYT